MVEWPRYPEVVMPNVFDVALVVLFAVLWPLAEHFWTWPRHLRSVASGDPDARSRLYSAHARG